LGLNPDFSVNAGTNYFTTDVAIKQQDPILKQQFYPNIDHKKIAIFYLKHPFRFINKLEVAANSSMTNRPYYLGSYEKAENLGYGAVSKAFGSWSELKRSVMPKSLLFLVLFAVLYFLVLIRKHVRASEVKQRIYLETYMVIGLLGGISFVVPIIGDGEADLSKHLFMFDVCFDMMLVTSVVWLIFAIFFQDFKAKVTTPS
jgi:hypothetical protein